MRPYHLAFLGLVLAAPARRPTKPVALDAWSVIFDRPATGKYEDMAFPDAKHGWLITARGDILHSTDGGLTWMSQMEGMRALRSIDMIDAKRGFAGTLEGRLFATIDGGAQWQEITTTLPSPARGFCGMTHVGNRMHIVGRYRGNVTDYFYSPDAGKTWEYQDLSSMAQGLVDIMFVDEKTGFIGGMSRNGEPGKGPAIILKTTDGGKHWRPVFEHAGGRGFAWKLWPISKKMIYASLQSEDGVYRIAKTTDAGEHWDTLTVATDRPKGPAVQGIGFIDEKTGWVGGFFQGMYGTTDGGKTWTFLNVPTAVVNRFEHVGKTLITAGSRGVYRFDG
jgi:photosystem II stability/assembly factor-like uncharacterized protein